MLNHKHALRHTKSLSSVISLSECPDFGVAASPPLVSFSSGTSLDNSSNHSLQHHAQSPGLYYSTHPRIRSKKRTSNVSHHRHAYTKSSDFSDHSEATTLTLCSMTSRSSFQSDRKDKKHGDSYTNYGSRSTYHLDRKHHKTRSTPHSASSQKQSRLVRHQVFYILSILFGIVYIFLTIHVFVHYVYTFYEHPTCRSTIASVPVGLRVQRIDL